MTDPRLNELLSICRQLIEDGALVENEVHYLNRWIQAHPRVASRFPAQQIAARLQRIYADGKITLEERSELLDLLRKATRSTGEASAPRSVPKRLPLDDPPPVVEFMNRSFFLSGRFYGGSVKWCRSQIEQRDGDVHEHLNPSTDYLVIGAASELDPRVLDEATRLRSTLKVISEEHLIVAFRAVPVRTNRAIQE